MLGFFLLQFLNSLLRYFTNPFHGFDMISLGRFGPAFMLEIGRSEGAVIVDCSKAIGVRLRRFLSVGPPGIAFVGDHNYGVDNWTRREGHREYLSTFTGRYFIS